ncbi:MAG: DUF1016 N-terminal domain-containing protein [Candidatus Sericytochromatia bacterium]
MQFEQLLQQINLVHDSAQAGALRAVNQHLTLRNWLVGLYIVEYEQHGEDKAKYGSGLLKKLAKRLEQKSLSYRNLRLFRQFYISYPQIWQTVSAKFKYMIPDMLEAHHSQRLKPHTTSDMAPNDSIAVHPEQLLDRLCFPHFVELMKYDDGLQRTSTPRRRTQIYSFRCPTASRKACTCS